MTTFGPRRHDAMGAMLCDRCGRPTRAWCTSPADGAAICRACTVIELALPDNPGARVADEAVARASDYNYPEVGGPPDLIGA